MKPCSAAQTSPAAILAARMDLSGFGDRSSHTTLASGQMWCTAWARAMYVKTSKYTSASGRAQTCIPRFLLGHGHWRLLLRFMAVLSLKRTTSKVFVI